MQARKAQYLIYVFLIASILGISGCAPTRTYPAVEEGEVLFSPPTIVPTITPTPVPTPTPNIEITPTKEGACTNILSFVDDQTIMDGTEVLPGSSMDKRWKVTNTGTCNWDEGYSIRLTSGPEMGVPSQQALFPALGGSQAIIRILFTAPEVPGVHKSAWQAYSPAGQPFGDAIYIEIVVTEEEITN
jgi:hypothetical protein